MKYVFLILFLFNFKNAHCDYIFDTKYADVAIDHFSYTRNDTFKLKYLINDTYWTDGGPIFFYTGNEGDIENFAQNTGLMMELTTKFKALLVFCEHRYYGTSLPFGNLSFTEPKYLGYLSSEQALHDFVDVIDILQKSKYGEDGPLPVIAFGGSYGGMLAAWIRMKYPSSVLGAIASSAPIFQFTGLTPCGIFYSIVTNVYASSTERIDCSVPIKNLWPALRRISKTSDGLSWLSSTWKLCKNLTKQDDMDDVISDISEMLVNIAMVNYPYPSSFLADLPAYPVNGICSKLGNYESYLNDDKKFIGYFFDAISIYTNYTGKAQCTELNPNGKLGDLGWDFQSCTEMVMPLCTDKSDMFEISSWNFDKYSNDCLKKFGVKPPNPSEVILRYGGKNIESSSNIVFSNGLLDPWSGGGVLSNISKSLPAIIIPEGAHHLDLRASNQNDPLSVVRARKFHADSITGWLNDYYKEKFSRYKSVLNV